MTLRICPQLKDRIVKSESCIMAKIFLKGKASIPMNDSIATFEVPVIIIRWSDQPRRFFFFFHRACGLKFIIPIRKFNLKLDFLFN